MQGHRICPLFVMLCEISLGKGHRGVPILLSVLVWFDSYMNIIQSLVTSQFSAAPVKALPLFCVSIAGASLRASLGLCS